MDFGDKKDKNARKFQCFVCGKQFPDYEPYREHIVAEHDEGREYLKCPACEAPVRDLRSHFNVKHPSRVLPKTGQMKVTVWYDFKDGKRKARKPKFKDGNYVSTKTGATLHYRSGYECEVYELLDEDTEVLSFSAEPFRIPYVFEGQWHDYIPDIRINFTDSKVEIWEVKPSSQTDLAQNKAKWCAMDSYADKMGWKFMVVTEIGMEKLRQRIKQQRLIREMGS